MEREGIKIFWREPIVTADELDLVNNTVSEIFAGRRPTPYVVTDCDVDLACASPHSIAIYFTLLRAIPQAACVGPMLRIEDIPQSYPLFARVMNLHIGQFWHRYPRTAQIGDVQVAYILAPIDTTFAVHQSGQPFRRLKNGIRVSRPFDARHLDWYPDEQTTGPYHGRSAVGVSHWDNRTYRAEHVGVKMKYHRYRIVVEDDPNHLAVRTRRVRDNPP
jgi:hypothetical protein